MKNNKDISKLPKWAREELEGLRERVAADDHYWKSKALEAANATASNTQLVTHYGEEPRALPNDTAIRFVLGDDGGWVEVGIRNGHLQVMGGTCLQIRPTASNVVLILARDED